MTEATDHQDIRDAVAKLCAQYPGEYWRRTDRERAYPTEFVTALTEAGFLSILIPEEYGGSGLDIRAAAAVMEEIHKAGCNGAACHAQMYTMGTVLRHGSDGQKQEYLPKIASLILTICGIFFILVIIIDFLMKPPRPSSFKRTLLPLTIIQYILLPVTGFFFSALPGMDAHTRLLFGKNFYTWVTDLTCDAC